MKKGAPEGQITEWLKKLQQESWQLELLVSAFTIFLLFQAGQAYDDYFDGLPYRYSLNSNILVFIYFFFGLLVFGYLLGRNRR